MAVLSIREFGGLAPVVHGPNANNAFADTAHRALLSDGAIRPAPDLTQLVPHNQPSGVAGTIFPLPDPDTNDTLWLTWPGEVHVETPSSARTVGEQRVYFLENGELRVTTPRLAKQGGPPYPGSSFKAGLPLPDTAPIVTGLGFGELPVVSFRRRPDGVIEIVTGSPLAPIGQIDTGNPATVTVTNHGFSTGDQVVIFNTGDAALDNKIFTITVTSTNTFQLDGVDRSGGSVIVTGEVSQYDFAHDIVDGSLVTIKGFKQLKGTYSQSSSVITVTINNHGLVVGSKVLLTFTSGNAVSGFYAVDEVVSPDEFKVNATDSASRSGNVTLDLTDLNYSSARANVVGDGALEIYAPGYETNTIITPGITIDLAGFARARTYLFTYVNEWGEESIASEPSSAVFVKTGEAVLVTGLPTAGVADYNIRGIRLYRTVASSSGEADFLLLSTLWFPVQVNSVSGNEVVTATPHGLSVGQRFAISNGVRDARVTAVIDDYTFQFSGGVGSGGAGGTLYHDVAEDQYDDAPRYWGEAGFDFRDDFKFSSLGRVLASDDNDPPIDGLDGLVSFGQFMVAFKGRTLYFSEPRAYHAWPVKHRRSIGRDIVALIPSASYLIVLTNAEPYLISGTDPAVLSIDKVPVSIPCASRRSIAQTQVGAVFATYDGLVLASPSGQFRSLTPALIRPEEFEREFNPSSMIGVTWRGRYMAFYQSPTGQKALVVDRLGADLPVLTTTDFAEGEVTAVTAFFGEGKTHVAIASNIYEMVEGSGTYRWVSKELHSPEMLNIAALQLDADFDGSNGISVKITGRRLFGDEDILFDRVVGSRDPVRVSIGNKYDRFRLDVSGNTPLYGVFLAGRMEELRTV